MIQKRITKERSGSTGRPRTPAGWWGGGLHGCPQRLLWRRFLLFPLDSPPYHHPHFPFKTLDNLPLTPIWSAPSPFTNYIKIKRWIDGAQESNGTTWRATTRSQSYAKTNPGIWGKKEITIQEYVQNYTNVFPNTSVVLFYPLFLRFVLGGKWSFFGNSSSWVKIFCQISSKTALIGIAFHPFYKMPPFLVPW